VENLALKMKINHKQKMAISQTTITDQKEEEMHLGFVNAIF